MVVKRVLLPCVAAATVMAAGGAPAAHRPDQDAALDAVRRGRSQPLPMLERRVVPQVKGDYLRGSEYDEGSNTYRMKFMRGGTVIWIDVDGRTGQIVRRSGQ